MAEQDNKMVDLVSAEHPPKLMHAGENWYGQPYVFADEGSIRIAGSLDRGISVSPQFGTLIQGPMAFSEAPELISLGGGYWRFNPMLTACIGSSAAIPVPTLVPDEPAAIKAKKDIKSIFGDMLGGIF